MNPCPVCGGTDTRFFAHAWDAEYCTSREIFSYAGCNACAVVFLDPPPLDRHAEIYPPTYYSSTGGGSDSFALRLKNRLDGRLMRRILRHLPPGPVSVLEIGGGTGWLLSLLRRLDSRVVETHEVDCAAAARAAAEAAGHVFHCVRAEEFTCERRFELIVMLNLIEHLAEPGRVLASMAALLSDEGLILVKTPNTDTLDRRLFQHHNWGGFHCPRHWVLFTKPGFIDLARRCGLECVWARYTQGAPQWTNSILGWLADKGIVRITADRPMHTHPLHAPLLALTAAIDFARRPFMPTAQMFILLRHPRTPPP